MLSNIVLADKTDSLAKVSKLAKTPESKIQALLNLGNQLIRHDIDSALSCGNKAMRSAKELKNQSLSADAHLFLGFCLQAKGNYKAALKNFLSAADYFKKHKDKEKLSKCYTALGVVCWYQGFYSKAIDYYKKNITLSTELKDKHGLAASYGNMAIIFDEQKDLDNALLYYNRALQIFEEEKDVNQTAACLDNMSLIFKQKKDYKMAMDYNIRGYKLREGMNDTIGMLASMENLGSIFNSLEKFDAAIELSDKVLAIATRLGAKEDVKYAYYNLKEAYEGKREYKEANEILNKLMEVKDSLRNIENANQIAELETKFKTREKETELSEIKLIQQLREKENSEKLKRKNYFIGVLSLIGAFILVIVFILFKRYKEKREIAEAISKQNQAIESQKTLIDKAYQELSVKNKDITDSIKYAQRIQNAIYPSPAYFTGLFPESFVFFKPKDIVSGDFYWVEQDDEGSRYLAVVDCTGHGVPGAFLSMVGFNLLNNAIREQKCKSPAEILNYLNSGLIEILKQTEEESIIKDGMEISVCKWNMQTKEFLFAGANSIIYHIANKQINVVRGDKHAVGGFYGEDLKPFTNLTLNVNKGDCLYLFSDGYADQFGGEKGKKYKYKQLEDFLLNVSGKEMTKQMQDLSAEFTRWKGSLDQVDDVCLIGIKI